MHGLRNGAAGLLVLLMACGAAPADDRLEVSNTAVRPAKPPHSVKPAIFMRAVLTPARRDASVASPVATICAPARVQFSRK